MRTIVVGLVALLALAGCGKPESPAPPVDREAALAKAKAVAAALRDRLGARLTEAVAAGGPAAAVDVCRDAAPEIAAAVGAEHGVRVGRSSHRLRSPANEPPAWAASRVDDPNAAAEPAVVARPDGGAGVTLPIRLAAMCTTCHGAAEEIPAEVAAALAAAYPEDRATGFSEGDLRGFFWVEIPPAR